MSANRMAIYVQNDLKEKMQKSKYKYLNWSKIAQDAFQKAMIKADVEQEEEEKLLSEQIAAFGPFCAN